MIDNFTERLYQAMEQQLSEVTLNHGSLTAQYRASILICKKAMSKLKSYVSSYDFSDQNEEIHFFKEIKPRFYSRYIYFINVYNFLMQRPAGGEETHRAHIQFHLADLQRFFDNNKAFYQYYRSGSIQMDKVYFTRGGFDVQMELEDFEEDEQYSTSHDYKQSKLIANEKFREYLQLELAKLNQDESAANGGYSLFPFVHPTWTAGQIDAVELIYALKASGAINNGNVDIAELISLFEFIFQMEIREPYHKFADITNRKKDIPIFHKRLSEALLRWIDDRMGMAS